MSANPLSNHTPQKVVPKIQQKPAASYTQFKAVGLAPSPSKPPLIAARPLAPLLPATAQPNALSAKSAQPVKKPTKNDGPLVQQARHHSAGSLTQEQLNQIAAALQQKNAHNMQPISSLSNGQFYQFIPIQPNGVKLQQPLIIAPVAPHLISQQQKNSNIQPKPSQPYLHQSQENLSQFIFQTVPNKSAVTNATASNANSANSNNSAAANAASQPVQHQLTTTSTNIQLLQQRLAEEEQRQEQLLKQLNEKKHSKTKSPEKQAKSNEMEVDEPNENVEKPDEPNSSGLTSSGQNKKRGRPRLYAVDATTGKSIKGKLIENAPVKQKPQKMPIQSLNFPPGFTIYPSPSTSTSSSYSQQQNFIINQPAQFNPQFIPLNIVQPMVQEEKNVDLSMSREEKQNDSNNNNNSNNNSNKCDDKNVNEEKIAEENSEKENFEMCVEQSVEEPSVHKTPHIEAKKLVDTLKNFKSEVVLTHVIDGFVIKESSKPFPVKPNDAEINMEQRTPPKSTSTPFNNKKRDDDIDKMNNSRLMDDQSLLNTSNTSQKSKSKSRPKQSPKKPRKSLSDDQEDKNKNIATNATNVIVNKEDWPAGDPTEWNCDQVYTFVFLVAGQQVAEMFKSQEMDGSALNLIRDDHLVNTMGVKLGPALKIMSKFNELKIKFSQSL